jgi:hypothetical protein
MLKLSLVLTSEVESFVSPVNTFWMGACSVQSIIFMTGINEQLHDKVVYHAFSLRTGSSDIVTGCHVRDPSSFYVQRVVDRATAASLSLQLSKHVHTLGTPRQSVHKGKYKVTILVYCGDFHSVR